MQSGCSLSRRACGMDITFDAFALLEIPACELEVKLSCYDLPKQINRSRSTRQVPDKTKQTCYEIRRFFKYVGHAAQRRLRLHESNPDLRSIIETHRHRFSTATVAHDETSTNGGVYYTKHQCKFELILACDLCERKRRSPCCRE